MGEYELTRVKVQKSFRSAEFRGPWELFFEAIARASVMSVGASRTGNQTLLRVRVHGKRHELRLETSNLRSASGRSYVVGGLLQRFLPCEWRRFIESVQTPGESLWERTVGTAFAPPVLDEARARGVRFLDECVALVFKNEVGRRQNEYQLEMAMGEFRTAVRTALDRGASFTDMEGVLKEMAVLSVMES